MEVKSCCQKSEKIRSLVVDTLLSDMKVDTIKCFAKANHSMMGGGQGDDSHIR